VSELLAPFGAIQDDPSFSTGQEQEERTAASSPDFGRHDGLGG
jgi:hypothetical protein